MKDVCLKMVDINKSFGGGQVLYDISLEVKKGEVLALLGHNGAGKSVLMKTLMGVHKPDGGEYFVNKKKVFFSNPNEAQKNNVSMVYQEFGLVDSMSITENVLMGKLPSKFGKIDWKLAHDNCSKILQRFGSNISPKALVGSLKVAEKQEVEIARALSYDPVVFIMDEPTSALGYDDIMHLYDLVNILRKQDVAIIYITHKLNEVFDLADRVIVIRDGHVIGNYNITDLNVTDLVEKMTGKRINIEIVNNKKELYAPSRDILKVGNLSREGMFYDINFQVVEGEIVGIAGVIGAGKTELAKALFGALPKSKIIDGEYVFNGQELNPNTMTPRYAKKLGIGFVTEDRKMEGMIHDQTVLFNIILTSFFRVTRYFTLLPRLFKKLVNEIIKDITLRPPEPNRLVKYLSGGNQQKVVIGKWLAAKSKLLMLDEPTRGVDVGARDEIYSVIKENAKQGTAVLLFSSDLREIMLLSDRIIVMRLGRFTHELSPNQVTEKQLIHMVLGRKYDLNN